MRPDDIRFWLLLWLIVSSSTVSGLVAIWAALSTRHWFARAAVLLGIAWLLALVPASDLVFVFVVEIACVVAPLLLWRSWRERAQQDGESATHGRMRFRLAELLLITTVFAVVAAIVGQFSSELLMTWPIYLVWGGACGCTIAAACCAILGGRAPILTAITPLVAAFWPSQLPDLFGGLMLSNPPCLYDWGWPVLAWYPALALVAIIIVIWLLLFRAMSGRLSRGALTPHWFPAVAPWLVAGLSAFLVAPLALAYWQMLTPTPRPVVVLPTPNGYDELKRLGERLTASVTQNVAAATEAELSWCPIT